MCESTSWPESWLDLRSQPKAAAMPASCSGVSWKVTYRQRSPCSSSWVIQRSPKMVFPIPEGPVSRVASPCFAPPLISSSRPGIPLRTRWPETGTGRCGMSVSIRGNTSTPAGPIRNVCLPDRGLVPRSFTTRSHRRSTGSRAWYSSWMMPSARENSTSPLNSAGVYSPSSSKTVSDWANRPVRSYSAVRSSRSSANSRSIFALSITTIAGSSSSPFRTISDVMSSSPSWRPGTRKSPRWMYSTRGPSASASKKENASRCLTSLVCGSDTVV